MLTDAQRQAIDRYRKSEKGKAAFRRVHDAYVQTPEGREAQKRAEKKFEEANKEARREYKRLKAREYRQKKKQQSESSVNTEMVVPTEINLQLPAIKVAPDVEELLRLLPNSSEFIRDAVIKALREEGLLPDDQDSSRDAA